MEWLVGLLVLLGLGALAGLVWLHFGRASAVAPPDASMRRLASGPPGGDAVPAELSITIGYLRRRASHYRDMAVKVDDAVAGARCWDLARLFDRAAEALANTPEEETPTRES
jgi:hypothetical protein